MAGLPSRLSDAERVEATYKLLTVLETGLRSRKFTVQAMPGRAEVIEVESGDYAAQIGLVDLTDRDAVVERIADALHYSSGAASDDWGDWVEEAEAVVTALFSGEVDRAR